MSGEFGERNTAFEPKQVIGVIHGADYVNIISGETYPKNVEPSRELRFIIDSLPKGSTVGIEYHPLLAEGFANKSRLVGSEILFSPSTINYWNRVSKICNDRELKIVYLDDVKTTIEAACYQLEASDDADYIGMREEQLGFIKDDDSGEYVKHMREEYGIETSVAEEQLEIAELEKKYYAHRVISDYLLQVKREEIIFRKITQQPFDLVILGEGHGDIYAAKYGTRNYKKEMVGTGGQIYISETMSDFEDENIDRKLLVRKYNTLVEGRIDPARGDVSFVGYWNDGSHVKEQGFFEMYIDQEEKPNNQGTIMFSGIIIDNLGDAKFLGYRYINSNIFRFEKQYIRGASSRFAAFGGIYYDGIIKDGIISGGFFIQRGGLQSGEFTMQHLSDGKTLLPKIDTELSLFKPENYYNFS